MKLDEASIKAGFKETGLFRVRKEKYIVFRLHKLKFELYNKWHISGSPTDKESIPLLEKNSLQEIDLSSDVEEMPYTSSICCSILFNVLNFCIIIGIIIFF